MRLLLSRLRSGSRRWLPAAGLLALLVAAPALAASVYGEGDYSGCGFNQACPATPTPSATPQTIQQTDTGLTYATNLAAGQTIPAGTYTVTVTPLNGRGASFAKVEFYLDGHLARTALPGTTGTFYWPWTTGAPAGHTIRVVAYDPAGTAYPQDYQVTVVAAPPAPASSNPLTAVRQQLAQLPGALKRTIQQIPVPVAYSFPYILFVLMGLSLLLLVLQTQQEVAGLRALLAAVDRQRRLSAAKLTFVQLASHYLRTPLAVIRSGLDLGTSLHQIDPPTATSLGAIISQLGAKVEQLLTTITAEAQAAVLPPPSPLAVLRQPGFWLPLGLLGGATFGFNWILLQTGRISLVTLNLITQLAVFGLLTLLLYVLLRDRILRRRRHAAAQESLAAQLQVDQLRNQLVAAASTELGTYIRQLHDRLPQLSGQQAATAIADGCRRFEAVLAKFETAGQLTGHSSGVTGPAERCLVSELVQAALEPVQAAIQQKQLTLNLPADQPFTTHRPELLRVVLASLVDNAVSYSPDHGSISLTAGPLSPTVYQIAVTDHGPGLAADQLAQLFQPFFRAEGALNFNHEGMGFSLYLARLIMTYLDGDITLESQPGQSTRAIISFPIRAAGGSLDT